MKSRKHSILLPYNISLLCGDDCVTSKVLHWRVRVVFTLYGKMMDSKSKAPLFNDHAQKRADNVLLEILDGCYSDPPEVFM